MVSNVVRWYRSYSLYAIGLIFHASLVGQAAPKYKGKISRALASKTALSIRADALNEGELDNSLGLENRAKIEARLRQLESGQSFAISGRGRTSGGDFRAYQAPRTPASGYQTVTDTVIMTDTGLEEKTSVGNNESGWTTPGKEEEEEKNESLSSHKKKEKKKRKRDSAGDETHSKEKKKRHKKQEKE